MSYRRHASRWKSRFPYRQFDHGEPGPSMTGAIADVREGGLFGADRGLKRAT
jgi:hypothetical protein